MRGERKNVVTMFGIDIIACDLLAAASMITDAAKEKKPELVITPNVDHVVTIKQHPEIAKIYQAARFVFADGMPLVWLSVLLPGSRLPERVTGADLLGAVCAECSKERLSIGFVGGAPGVAEKAASIIETQYSGIKIAGTYSPPWGFDANEEESEKVVALCRAWNADVICLAFGAPKQELWAAKYATRLGCGPLLCFGAAIDFVAGTYSRAPLVLQNSGLEWVWRLCQEPRRMFRRYFIRDSIFFWYAACEISSKWISFFKNKNEYFKK